MQQKCFTSKLRELVHANSEKKTVLDECDQLDRIFDDLFHLVGRVQLCGEEPKLFQSLKDEAARLLLRL